MTATASRTNNRRPELLAPAGGPEPFAAALAAGADAIYCGMGSFNARRKATNFTDEAFEQACRAAHLAGSRVYVTVNIVIKESEMSDALQLIHRCSTLGADAFIIQDWGLFFEVKRTMPSIETHISTQANIHDDRGTLWCREQGADRVTLSRELSIDEIAAIHDAAPDVDLEVFSHGAICFCYSGLCLLSSFAMAGRSANRGMCAQPCRLPYELIDENGRSLSPAGRERALCPRDTNTSQLVRRLYDAGAASLKLEGRMKAPDYVYSIVDVYRHQIDDMLADVSTSKDEEAARQRQLKRCFNRDFTHAYQDGTSGDEMMSYERSNNRGQIVGTVLGSRLANRDVRGLKPDDRRRRAAIARNHSVTHLMHKALRTVCGAHVAQKGSLVTPEITRFDFTHDHPVTAEQIAEVEQLVNEEILANVPTKTEEMSVEDAKKTGATMLFGEKYGKEVRVVSIGSSKELCGGTHVARTGDIGSFKIISEAGISAGVRRIEAVTGMNVLHVLQQKTALVSELQQNFRGVKESELPEKVSACIEQIHSLEKEVASLQAKIAASASSDIAENAREVNGVKVVAVSVDGADANALREMADKLRDKLHSAVVVLATKDGAKLQLCAGVTPDLVKKGLKAGELVKFVAAQVGGKGGGKPDFAMAGGSDAEALPKALESVYGWVGERA